MKITKSDIREAILEALNEEPDAPPTSPEGEVNSKEAGIIAQITQFFTDLAKEQGINLDLKRQPITVKLQQLAKQIKSDIEADFKTNRTGLSKGAARTAAVDVSQVREGCGDQMHIPPQEPQMHQELPMQHHHGDHGESEMAKSQLYRASQYAGELEQMIHDGEQLDAWVQAKITKASDYLSSVKHYLQYKKSKGEH